MTTVTHIVPLFAPVIDGVGDYSLNLARALRSGHSLDSRFVVADPSWNGAGEVDGFSVIGPTTVEASRMSNAIENDGYVILHYVGYGYHRKGIPAWLVEAIEQWRLKNMAARLVTIFHEIWSSGPPWKSAFFLKPTQRALVARLLRQSCHAFVSTRSALRSLNRIAPNRTSFLPVSANILPLEEPKPHPRGSELFQPLIFGQPWTRRNAVERHVEFLRGLHRNRKLERVLVMGKGASNNAQGEDVGLLKRALPLEKIQVIGEVSAADAAKIFDQTDFLLSPTRPRDLCKSSAVMSAFACGCSVAVSPQFANDDPAPLSRTHFIVANDSDCRVRYLESSPFQKWNLQRVAAQARSWFLRNADWPTIAAHIAENLLIVSNAEAHAQK
jgi:hypothetical protein